MAKIGFKRLSRGVKLLTGHIHTQIQKSLTRFTSTGLDDTNMQTQNSRFRVSLPWSGLQPKRGAAGTTDRRQVQTAFTLAPPQEMFRSNGVSYPQDINFVLDSISLSFDQRAEAAAIKEDGSLDFDEVEHVEFTVNIFSKKSVVLGGTTGFPDNQLASITFDSLGFSNKDFVQNPTIKTGLGISVDPYQVLLVEVDLSAFQASATDLVINSLIVTLDFYAPLMQRDKIVSNDNELQNIPTSHRGARSISPVTTTHPVAGSVISADNNATGDGVQTAFEKIDTVFHNRLKGGYNEKSRETFYSNILNDAGYEVIAVPMWGNGWQIRGGSGATADGVEFLPLMGSSPYSDPVCDRRIIPLQFPLVVHHVFACVNVGSLVPSSATLTNKVGVGLGCGVRSDLFQSRQLAFAEWTPATKGAYEIDESMIRTENMQLMNIPLVYVVGESGTGYDNNVKSGLDSTGRPVFAGQALSTEFPRTSMAPSVGAAAPGGMPLMHGMEQYLEIRWEIRDSGGIVNMSANEGVIGFGGHWVYIVGKKHLC